MKQIMKRRRFLLRLVAAVLALVLLQEQTATCVYAKNTSEKLKEAQQEKAETEEKLKETQGQIGGLKSDKSALQGTLVQLNQDLSDISEQLSTIEQQLSEKEMELIRTQGEISDLEGRLQDSERRLDKIARELELQYDYMKKRIRHVYESRKRGYLELLLSATGFGEMLNHRTYVEKAQAFDRSLFTGMQEKKAQIEEQKAQIEEQKAQIEDKREIQERELEEVRALKDASSEEQSKVQGLLSKTSEEVSGLSGQIEEAEKSAAAYEEQIAEQNENIKKLQEELEKERQLASKSRSMAKKDLSQINVAGGERELLACLIYCEAGGEPYEGQVAVGAVVMNRCMSGAFPDTITGVIYQSGQFSPVASGRLATRLAKGADENCYRAADAAMAGENPIGDALFFRTVIPQIKGQIIGGHVFYNP